MSAPHIVRMFHVVYDGTDPIGVEIAHGERSVMDIVNEKFATCAPKEVSMDELKSFNYEYHVTPDKYLWQKTRSRIVYCLSWYGDSAVWVEITTDDPNLLATFVAEEW